MQNLISTLFSMHFLALVPQVKLMTCYVVKQKGMTILLTPFSLSFVFCINVINIIVWGIMGFFADVIFGKDTEENKMVYIFFLAIFYDIVNMGKDDGLI